MTKLLVCDGIWIDDFGQFDDNHVQWMRFSAFVKGVIDDLRQTTLGLAFLEVFASAGRQLDGGPRYGHAALVVRHPHPKYAANMPAISETTDLRYATTDLLGKTKDARGNEIRFQNKVGSGIARPAQIWLFAPNSQLPSGPTENLRNVVIEGDGRFSPRGEPEEFLHNVLMHEMVHAYHFVIGSMEPEIHRLKGNSDELRAVGLGVFRCYRFSENALRAAVGRPLRTSYHGDGTDAYLREHPGYFRDRTHSLDPTDVKTLAGEPLHARLVAWNQEARLPAD